MFFLKSEFNIIIYLFSSIWEYFVLSLRAISVITNKATILSFTTPAFKYIYHHLLYHAHTLWN